VSPDDTWKRLNHDALKHASENNWGLFSNTQLKMADYLLAEGKQRQALSMFLWVCYLDLNDGNNHGSLTSKEFPAFNPASGFLAPDVVKKVVQLKDAMELSAAEVQTVFMETVQKRRNKLMPMGPAKAWQKINAVLQAS